MKKIKQVNQIGLTYNKYQYCLAFINCDSIAFPNRQAWMNKIKQVTQIGLTLTSMEYKDCLAFINYDSIAQFQIYSTCNWL